MCKFSESTKQKLGCVYCASYVQSQQDKVIEIVVSDGGTYGFEISCSVHWYTV